MSAVGAERGMLALAGMYAVSIPGDRCRAKPPFLFPSPHSVKMNHPWPLSLWISLFKKIISIMIKFYSALDQCLQFWTHSQSVSEECNVFKWSSSGFWGLRKIKGHKKHQWGTLTFFAPCSSSTPSPMTTYTTFLPNLWIILSKQLSFPNEQK